MAASKLTPSHYHSNLKSNNNPQKPDVSNRSRAKIYSSEDPTKLFNIVDSLGTGSYGGVVKALDKRNGSEVAIKIVNIETDNTKELIREIAILSKCRSKYIVNYLGSYRHNDEIWITMEFCGAGSVGDILKITKSTFSETEIAVISKHTISGLKYLHKNQIIHRDIKCSNILLTMSGSVKLADFGVSAQLAQTISRRNTVIGSPYWMAPEVLRQNSYDQKADIWSMGIALMEMAEGKPPLSDLHPLRALLQIPSNPPPTLSTSSTDAAATPWTQSMHSFLARCLTKDPLQRATASELLKLSFLRTVSKNSEKTVVHDLVTRVMPKVEKYRERKRKRDREEMAMKRKQKEDKERADRDRKRKRTTKNTKKMRSNHSNNSGMNSSKPIGAVRTEVPMEVPVESGGVHESYTVHQVHGQYGNVNSHRLSTSNSKSMKHNKAGPEDSRQNEFDDSTMIIADNEPPTPKEVTGVQQIHNVHGDNEDEQKQMDQQQYATMIQKEPTPKKERKRNLDPRSPEYIISPLFTERSTVFKEFEIEDYIPDNATKEQLQDIRKAMCTAYWKDKQILEDYYMQCRRQIATHLDKIKKERKEKRRSGKKRHSHRSSRGSGAGSGSLSKKQF